MLPILYQIRYIHNVCMKFLKEVNSPRCTDYNGFWWDVDDKTSRIEVLSILIDIYERKLNDENLYYIG